MDTAIAFLDISQAYDTVCREKTWLQLHESGVTGKIWRVIKELYREADIKVMVGEYESDTFQNTMGLRQGCPSSPTLFNVIINPLIQRLKAAGKGVKMGTGELALLIAALLFADDIGLLAGSPADLQEQLDICAQFARENGLKFNVAKCAIFIHHMRGSPRFFLDGQEVPQVSNFKYLGVYVGEDNVDTITRKNRVEKAQQTVNKIWVNGIMKGMEAAAATAIWRAVIETTLTYGAEIWDNGDYKEIDAVQADLARKLMGTHKKNIPIAGLLADLGWRKTSYVMKKKRLIYAGHIRSPDAPPILKATSYWVVKEGIRYNDKKTISSIPNWEARTNILIKQLGLTRQWKQLQEGKSNKNQWKIEVEKAIVEQEKKELQQAFTKPNSKLRTLAKIKTTSGQEHYTTSLPRRDRRIIAELRCGVASLEIETGRWRNVPPEDRRCCFCPDKVEDEQHFLLECTEYKEQRQELYLHLLDSHINVNEMDNTQRLKFLLSECGKHKRVLKFIRAAWSLRIKGRKQRGLA